MATRQDVDDFLAHKQIAFVGVSRDPKQFANMVYRALRDRGHGLYPVNPQAKELEGVACYPSLADLPGPVDGALIMVPAPAAEGVVRQAWDAGIRRVWLGKGTASPEAVAFCREKGISVVDGECPMMFAEPVGLFHRCHRFVKGLSGSLPS